MKLLNPIIQQGNYQIHLKSNSIIKYFYYYASTIYWFLFKEYRELLYDLKFGIHKEKNLIDLAT